MGDEWEVVARRVLSFYVHEQLEEVEPSTYELMNAIAGGDDVSARQIHATRHELIDL